MNSIKKKSWFCLVVTGYSIFVWSTSGRIVNLRRYCGRTMGLGGQACASSL